jgi:hypothetical protein
VRRGFVIAFLCAAAARAQEEPTPFWLPPPPPKKEAPKPAKKKPVRPKHAPIEVDPETAPKPRAPAATLPPPAEPTPAGEPASPREPAPARKSDVARDPALAPAREPAPASDPALAATPDLQADPSPTEADRTLSVAVSFGAWSTSPSDGSSRSWQLAYGVRFGFAIFPSLEGELDLIRTSATAGSPFVNASTAHNLAALRAFYVLGDRLALLLGGGGGVAIVQTHYTLQPSTDLNSATTAIDATGIKPVIEVTAAARARIFRGLEARAEVSALGRNGRIDFLPLLGAGWSF